MLWKMIDIIILTNFWRRREGDIPELKVGSVQDQEGKE